MNLGNVVLGGVPRVVVVVTDRNHNNEIAAAGADILEVRADEFSDNSLAHVQMELGRMAGVGLPMILTVRNDPAEGGRHAMTDEHKHEIFKLAMPLVDAVDIELSSGIISSVIELARRHGKTIIVSSHDFQSTLADDQLEDLWAKSVRAGGNIVKIAMLAKAQEDIRRLMAFTLRHSQDRVITMSLGRAGSISRLALPAMGSLLTYSYLGMATAPGQVPLARLQEDLKFYYPDYRPLP